MGGEFPLRTRVKMCGTTRLDDALAAVCYGVDALGFIFYPKSPRYITADGAMAIIGQLPPFVDRVGVFVNGQADDLVKVATTGLSCLQLHGDESPVYCSSLRDRLPNHRIIKAFRVGADSLADHFTPYNQCVDAFLLDTYVAGTKGGTGKAFDWSIIERLELQRPIVLAGGLTAGNVVQAIRAVKPFAVDVNSGVESRPGVKDHQLLRRLMQLVAGIK